MHTAQGHCAIGAQRQLNPSSKGAIHNANPESESIACCRYSIFYGISRDLFINCVLNIEITLIVFKPLFPTLLNNERGQNGSNKGFGVNHLVSIAYSS